jgi:protein-S-isoprenylcysteine O-methyltransferase Ste14
MVEKDIWSQSRGENMYPLLIYTGMYAILFWIAFSLWWIPETVGAFLQHAKAGDQTKVQDGGSYLVVMVLLFGSLGLAFLFVDILPRAMITWNQIPVFFVGIALMLVGIAFRWYAIWTLGRFFTRNVAIHADQKVVQNGPYRLMRHPAYAGTILAMLGLGLAMTNWVSILVLGICNLLGHLYRIHVEEESLRTNLGLPYVTYMQRTKRLIPFVY